MVATVTSLRAALANLSTLPNTFPQTTHCTIIKLKKLSHFKVNAKLSNSKNNDDPLFQSAIHAATLRFQETHQPEPLFVDPYVACLVPSDTPLDNQQFSHPYCLATRFIDDKLLQTLKNTDDIKQVVLLTDGADTRPYRLKWPRSTLIFDISPEWVFMEVSGKLKEVGAKVPKSCLLLHVALESSNIQEVMLKKGFSGSRPSLWVFQGLPVMTLESFEDVLFNVGSLAMKGCLLIGEMPAWLAETQVENKTSLEEWMHMVFMRHGFQVQTIDYVDAAQSLGRETSKQPYDRILFVAEQTRFSDDQMETWRREFQRAEEDGDEEGFEDL